MPKTLYDSPNAETINPTRQRARQQLAPDSVESEGISTLIDFPGRRAVPEWRKKLSQRVREVQEQKAREAAEANQAAREAGAVSCELPSGQLELVPELDEAPLNPIVSKALQRVNRARREYSTSTRSGAAAAPAYSTEALEETETQEQPIASKPKLAIVSAAPSVVEDAEPELDELVEQPAIEEPKIEEPKLTEKKSVRLISESVEDAALSYLDTCLSVPALASDTRRDLAGLTRRTIVGVCDLIVIATMVSPVAYAIQTSRTGWTDSRSVGLLVATAVIATFAYLTISIALSGRTLSMRILSVKTIDARTGLIPTGGQSIKRAIAYIFSLALLGLGFAAAFVDRDHRTLHDRFSKTIVVRS
jgi:uncharacterized RDD family membrane protein YckC